jgi:hypothetical protein
MYALSVSRKLCKTRLGTKTDALNAVLFVFDFVVNFVVALLAVE